MNHRTNDQIARVKQDCEHKKHREAHSNCIPDKRNEVQGLADFFEGNPNDLLESRSTNNNGEYTGMSQ